LIIIRAQIWDGVTDYKVEETEHEREDRLKKWDQFISGGKTND
jgi:HIV Tat-specific factor 1